MLTLRVLGPMVTFWIKIKTSILNWGLLISVLDLPCAWSAWNLDQLSVHEYNRRVYSFILAVDQAKVKMLPLRNVMIFSLISSANYAPTLITRSGLSFSMFISMISSFYWYTFLISLATGLTRKATFVTFHLGNQEVSIIVLISFQGEYHHIYIYELNTLIVCWGNGSHWVNPRRAEDHVVGSWGTDDWELDDFGYFLDENIQSDCTEHFLGESTEPCERSCQRFHILKIDSHFFQSFIEHKVEWITCVYENFVNVSSRSLVSSSYKCHFSSSLLIGSNLCRLQSSWADWQPI